MGSRWSQHQRGGDLNPELPVSHPCPTLSRSPARPFFGRRSRIGTPSLAAPSGEGNCSNANFSLHLQVQGPAQEELRSAQPAAAADQAGPFPDWISRPSATGRRPERQRLHQPLQQTTPQGSGPRPPRASASFTSRHRPAAWLQPWLNGGVVQGVSVNQPASAL